MPFIDSLDIANRACTILGSSPITSTTEDSVKNTELTNAYDKLRRPELRRNVWRFAIKKCVLRAVNGFVPASASTPAVNPTMLLIAPFWSSTETYTPGSIVQDVNGFIWVSMQEENLNNIPGGNNELWEAYFGQMTVQPYDLTNSTAYYAGELVYVLAPGGSVSSPPLYQIYMSLMSGNSDVPNTPTQWSGAVATAYYGGGGGGGVNGGSSIGLGGLGGGGAGGSVPTNAAVSGTANTGGGGGGGGTSGDGPNPGASGGSGYVAVSWSGGVTLFSTTPDDGVWVVPAGVSSVNYLVVGGGGGGGTGVSASQGCGGGGGGQVLTGTLAVTPGQVLNVSVGAGGAAASAGQNSVFGSITAHGGNPGAEYNGGFVGGSTAGGSGGGGSSSPSGGVGGDGGVVSGVGINSGGNGLAGSTAYGGGGGGGSGGAGANGTGSAGGAGGIGLQVSFSGPVVTYYGGQIVEFSELYWESLIELNTNNIPVQAPAIWLTTTAYTIGNQVAGSDSFIYTAKGSTTGNNPTTDGGVHWTNTGLLAAWTASPNTWPSDIQWAPVQNCTMKNIQFDYPIGSGPTYDSQTKNAFRLPANFLRMANPDPKAGAVSFLGAPSGRMYSDWNLEGNYITSMDPGLLIIRFVADIIKVRDFDDLFAEGLASRMAFETCERITQATDKQSICKENYGMAIGEARAINAIEIGAEEPPVDDWISTRL